MKLHLRLKTKIVLGIMAINAIAITVIAGTFFNTNLALLDSRLESRISTEMDLLAQSVGAALLFDDKRSATEMLASLSVDPAIVSAELFALNASTPLASYYSSNQAVLSTNYANYARKVEVDGEVHGRLELVVTQDEIEAQTQQMVMYAVAILAIALLLALLGAIRLQNMVTLPITNLNKLSKEVARTRDYSLRSTIENQDEIGALALEFNRMLAQIQNRDLMLEKQVHQRTAELEKLAEEFRHRAFHDSLTSLPNRAFLNEYFESAAAHARRTSSKILMLLLDLDNFKTINDSLGHNIGDELLKSVALKLKRSMREEDVIVRLGGDEFVVLVSDIDPGENFTLLANTVAEKILNYVHGDTLIEGQHIRVTASIGGSIYPDNGRDLVDLKRSADIAMYDAKNQGRNRFSLFEPSMESSTVEQLVIQNDLRQGLLEEQLQVVYQPKIDARTQTVTGCEALVRWEHPTEGLLSPINFISFAEQNGLIRNVDYYVMERACLQARIWRDIQAYPIRVSVNLSTDHFSDLQIVEKIKSVLELTQLSPTLLEVEITEEMLIDSPDMALEVLSEIKKLGVYVSLDDFGVGYSSLGYLRKLPVDAVKLDRSFIKNILLDKRDAQLTEGIIGLLDGLGLDVLAEGVETHAQERFLLDMGCYHMQGFLYLRPCNAIEFANWVSDAASREQGTPPRNQSNP